MENFGKKAGDFDDRLLIPSSYSLPHNPIEGQTAFSTAEQRKGLHVFSEEQWFQLAKHGDMVYVEGLLSEYKKCFRGIDTKLPLTFSKKDVGYNHTRMNLEDGSFQITKPTEEGVWLFFSQCLHNAADGTFSITKNGNIASISKISGAKKDNTVSLICVEDAKVGDKFELYFTTYDRDCVVMNDYYSTKLFGVKIK